MTSKSFSLYLVLLCMQGIVFGQDTCVCLETMATATLKEHQGNLSDQEIKDLFPRNCEDYVNAIEENLELYPIEAMLELTESLTQCPENADRGAIKIEEGIILSFTKEEFIYISDLMNTTALYFIDPIQLMLSDVNEETISTMMNELEDYVAVLESRDYTYMVYAHPEKMANWLTLALLGSED